MNDNSRRQFFLQPQDPAQRRYEAIRAVVIDGLPIREAAERFDFAYGTLRNLLSQFDRQLQEQETPHPLLSLRGWDDHRAGGLASSQPRQSFHPWLTKEL